MDKELLQRHEFQWETFSVLHRQSLDELIKNEIETRKPFGMRDDHVPKLLRDKLERDRDAWLDEWGPKGRQVKGIEQWQQNELRLSEQADDNDINTFSEAEMDDMFQHFIAEEELLSQMKELTSELDAIRDHYKNAGKEVPHATQQRMAKHLVTLREKWDGKPSSIPLDKWRTLNDEDLGNYTKSRQELDDHHNIIADHYRHPDDIPATTIARITQDEMDFAKEVNAYGQSLKAHQNENAQGIVSKEDFKEGLKAIKERNEQTVNRPKPG